MNKILLTGLLSLGVINSLAQWNTSGTNTIHTNTGNVGIGVDPPLEKLHINGSVRGNASGGALRINTATGYLDMGSMNSSWAHFQTDRAKFYFNKPVHVDGAISSYNTNDLIFQTNGNTRIVALNSNGNVGIGTTAPSHPLSIFKDTDASLSITTQQSTSKSTVWFRINQSGRDGALNYHNDGRLSINLDASNASGVENNEYVSILSNGNVGIGTTNPGTTKLAIVNQSNQAYYNAFSINSINPNTHWPLVINTNGLSNHSGFVNDSDSDIYFLLRDKNGNTDVQLHSEGYSYINGGNVGIGTTTPDTKLAVKGTIHAEEVKVDLSVPGPDYVFEDHYKLPTLEDIKAYIEQNKHLPEIPSAKEMETNGVNLGEMNMLLLKKIEELTLYVIELKKENELQHDLNVSQQKEIERLKSKIK